MRASRWQRTRALYDDSRLDGAEMDLLHQDALDGDAAPAEVEGGNNDRTVRSLLSLVSAVLCLHPPSRHTLCGARYGLVGLMGRLVRAKGAWGHVVATAYRVLEEMVRGVGYNGAAEEAERRMVAEDSVALCQACWDILEGWGLRAEGDGSGPGRSRGSSNRIGKVRRVDGEWAYLASRRLCKLAVNI